MKLFLNNILKGVATALVVVLLGGFTALNINVSPTSAMVLVSSSLVNSLNTNDDTKVDNEETLDTEEVFEEDDDSKLEIDEENNASSDDKDINTEEDNTNNNINEETNNQTNSNNNQSENQNSKPQEEIKVQGVYSPNLEVLSTIEPIETYHGKMTGYGPDCVGCSGITASGMNVMNGNIYYEDKTFGTIRIVAGDKSIPFGSIIKITGTSISTDPVIAIVLDRGGMIGFETWKNSYFDLLYESEQAALVAGRQDATFELLRSGY